ncbi:(Fe-S)-binding protein [Methanocella sp. CWC-04]|uniref:(Fe-S)-binding protein n=1 Tax=Methanooceanicella nereidis TaxID=2052831 RepID=A0AAP2W591_9EURY|nr:(Fe-S)-binding protein [Methanocella sp. CWC-04]
MDTRDCLPLSSLYYYLKTRVTGSLNEKDLDGLYRCALCNNCRLADLNLSVRNTAVNKGLVAPHLTRINKNINEFGNPYGMMPVRRENTGGIKETVLFRGCTPTYKTPEILTAAENLLKRKGIEYSTISDETCCGNILFNMGDRASGSGAVRKNIQKFKTAGVKRIITICPGCYNAFNKYYRGQDGFDPEVILAVDLLSGSTTLEGDFAIQDPCHAREKAGTVRKILPGSRKESAGPCCGAGGGVMSFDKSLASSKARKVVDGNSAKIVTYCPFCYVNLSSLKPGKVSDIYMLLDGHGC